jgi:hypothetical protein
MKDAPSTLGSLQARALFRAAILHALRDPLNVKLLLLFPACFAALWPYIGSPLIPAVAVVLLTLEPRFNNYLFLAPQEGEALRLFPCRWESVVAANNLAVSAEALVLFALSGLVVGYAAPEPISLASWGLGFLYLLTILPLLLHFGNLQTRQHPRREVGWTLGDLAEGLLFLLFAALSSVPFAIFLESRATVLFSLLYAGAGAFFWWKVSLPLASRSLKEGKGFLEVEP